MDNDFSSDNSYTRDSFDDSFSSDSISSLEELELDAIRRNVSKEALRNLQRKLIIRQQRKLHPRVFALPHSTQVQREEPKEIDNSIIPTVNPQPITPFTCIGDVPPEIIAIIFSHCSPVDLLSVSNNQFKSQSKY
jgi:hypothetical protein